VSPKSSQNKRFSSGEIPSMGSEEPTLGLKVSQRQGKWCPFCDMSSDEKPGLARILKFFLSKCWFFTPFWHNFVVKIHQIHQKSKKIIGKPKKSSKIRVNLEFPSK